MIIISGRIFNTGGHMVKKATKKKMIEKPRCGLCGSTKKKLTVTECCGNTICDDYDSYVLFSYNAASIPARIISFHFDDDAANFLFRHLSADTLLVMSICVYLSTVLREQLSARAIALRERPASRRRIISLIIFGPLALPVLFVRTTTLPFAKGGLISCGLAS